MSHFHTVAGLALALAAAAPAAAQVISQKTISAALAMDLARDTVAECQAKGFNVSAAVLDSSGVLKAFVRGDGARLSTVEVSRLKANTAAGLAIPTAALAGAVAKGGDAANIVHLPGVFAAPGGVPIMADGQMVGAIGVSGGPGGAADEACVQAAMGKLASRLK